MPLKLLSSASILVISPATAVVEVTHRIKSKSLFAIVSVQCQLRKMMMSGMVLMY